MKRAPLTILFVAFAINMFAETTDTAKTTSNAGEVAGDDSFRFSLIQFTDFVGAANNDRPNGLLQQQYRFYWPLLRKPVRCWNKESANCSMSNNQPIVQFLRSVTFPDILLNRLEKSGDESNYPVDKTLIKDTATDKVLKPYLTTMDLWKYSNLQIGGSVSLFSIKTDKILVQLQYGIYLLRNRPYYGDTLRYSPDSGRTASEFRAVNSFANRIEINIQSLHDADRVNIAATAGMLFISLKDSYYKQFDAAVVDPFDRTTTLLSANDNRLDRNARPIYYFSAVLEKSFGEKHNNKAFFRSNYFYQTGEYTHASSSDITRPVVFEKSRFHNHYLQMQVGVSVGLENLFRTKDETSTQEKTNQPSNKPSPQVTNTL